MGKLRVITDRRDLEGKTILLRADLDVETKDGKVTDDNRLQSCLPTIDYILKHGGKIIIIGHLGRPDGKVNPEFTLLPVAHWFAKGKPKETILSGFPGWIINKNITLLENIRFYKEEEENNEAFCKKLATLGDIYVDESFATSHRKHASLYGITKLLPSYAGLHLAKEVEILSQIMQDPEPPLVVLIGGAKLETKLPMVERMHHLADYVLVGGKIAANKELIHVQHEKIKGKRAIVFVADNSPDGLDITEKDAENFIQAIDRAATIIWNGPVGKMGNHETEQNTLKIAHAIADSKAYSVVGGGDTLAFLKKYHMQDKFSFVSTGGGAMLELLSGKKLPGIEVLEH